MPNYRTTVDDVTTLTMILWIPLNLLNLCPFPARKAFSHSLRCRGEKLPDSFIDYTYTSLSSFGFG